MNIMILGGDGFSGWPTSLHLSRRGHEVLILDNLSRRRIDDELGVMSLTPIQSLETRLAAWHEVSGKVIAFQNVEVARQYDRLLELTLLASSSAVVTGAKFQQPRAGLNSAPYHGRRSPSLGRASEAEPFLSRNKIVLPPWTVSPIRTSVS